VGAIDAVKWGIPTVERMQEVHDPGLGSRPGSSEERRPEAIRSRRTTGVHREQCCFCLFFSEHVCQAVRGTRLTLIQTSQVDRHRRPRRANQCLRLAVMVDNVPVTDPDQTDVIPPELLRGLCVVKRCVAASLLDGPVFAPLPPVGECSGRLPVPETPSLESGRVSSK